MDLHAISSTCALGFMLHDLNNELCSRFVDDLLLKDKKVKVIGSPDLKNCATLSAIIGEGNKHLFKNSLLGHIYLLIQILFEEVTHDTISTCKLIEDKLSRPAIYRQLALFSGEISPTKLAATARITIETYNNNYKLFGFYNLMEWRCHKNVEEIDLPQLINPHDYKTLIDDNNIFHPIITSSMKENSEKL
jgi:hypothetical protein